MRRVVACLIVAAATIVSSAGVASAQGAPEFKLGFGALAQALPTVVGSPLENEHSDPATGDSVQRTTTGIMVWRKADNVTAFTDGATTWLLGPLGLQSRSNSTLLSWEQASTSPAPGPAAAPAAPSPSGMLSLDAVTVEFSKSGNSWIAQGSVHNNQGSHMDAVVDFVGYDAGGHPVIDTTTVFVPNLAPGGTNPFTVRVPAVAEVSQWKTLMASWPVATRQDFSMDVGASQPLRIDPGLADAVNALKTLEEGSWLLKVAADHNVVVSEDYTGPGVLGSFDPDTGNVVISTDLEDTSAWARASVLAHELSHANNTVAGIPSDTPLQCYREEAQAFTRQSQIWIGLWSNRLPSDQIEQFHAELNDIATTVTKDPQGFAAQLPSRYRSECGPIAAGTAGDIVTNP